MKIYTLERRMTLPVGQAEAFSFFEDPRNLARITPPWLGFRIVNAAPVEMRQGAEIRYRIKVAGIPLTWKTLITEYQPPSYFVDRQAAGPYRLWIHRHEFREAPGGTEVSDRVDYALPFGWLGRIAHSLFVRRRLRQIFDYRHDALARAFRPSTH
jgi:ligand-binding SRPBCC domain-containing protein